MANALSSCVSSLRSSNQLLSSSISILDSGVNDFPRLSKVLQTTRVPFPFPFRNFSTLHSFAALYLPPMRFHHPHKRSELSALTRNPNPAFRTPPLDLHLDRPILPPRLPNPRNRLPPLTRRVSSRPARAQGTSIDCAVRFTRGTLGAIVVDRRKCG